MTAVFDLCLKYEACIAHACLRLCNAFPSFMDTFMYVRSVSTYPTKNLLPSENPT